LTQEFPAALLKNDIQVRSVAHAYCAGHLASKIWKEKFEEDYLYTTPGETISNK